MTIEEMKEARRRAEVSILTILQGLQDATGLCAEAVNVDRVEFCQVGKWPDARMVGVRISLERI